MSFDPKKDDFELNLAQDFEISEDKLKYKLKLRPWLIGVEDVEFTFFALKNKESQSPYKINFQGVDLKVTDKDSLEFSFTQPYFPFVLNLNFPILVKANFQNIEISKWKNIEGELPEALGPYKISETQKEENRIKKMVLLANRLDYKTYKYQKVELKIYKNIKDLIKALNNNEIDILISEHWLEPFHNLKGRKIIKLKSGTYYALFFNNERLKDVELRRTIDSLIPKTKYINKIFSNYARKIDEALDSNYYKLEKDLPILTQKPIVTTLQKFDLYYPRSTTFKEIALLTKKSLEKNNIFINLKEFEAQEFINTILKERQYDILLFGQSLQTIADPYSFWYSPQENQINLNLSLFSSERTDTILKQLRKEFDLNKRDELMMAFNKLFNTFKPASFLLSPDYIIISNKRLDIKNNLRLNFLEEAINLIIY